MARILLVIADETLRELLQNLLVEWGNTVETCGSYSGAEKQFRLMHKHYPYNMVIVDECLPFNDDGSVSDKESSIRLIEIILSPRNFLLKKLPYTISNPLQPRIILLSSLPDCTDRETGETPASLPSTIVHKGTELEKDLELKLKTQEIGYWEQRYKSARLGIFFSTILGSLILLKNIGHGSPLSSIVYLISIGIIHIVIYFFQMLPNHPARFVANYKKYKKGEG